jgi:hypothetical protein
MSLCDSSLIGFSLYWVFTLLLIDSSNLLFCLTSLVSSFFLSLSKIVGILTFYSSYCFGSFFIFEIDYSGIDCFGTFLDESIYDFYIYKIER